MTTTKDDILKLLNDDIVSYGLIAQLLKNAISAESSSANRVKELLEDLFASGKVEIGNATATAAEYVEFVAWSATNEQKVNRAMEAVANADGPDKEFAFWLCLQENVDRYEGDDQER